MSYWHLVRKTIKHPMGAEGMNNPIHKVMQRTEARTIHLRLNPPDH